NISEWMPGEDWDKEAKKYRIAPEEYTIEQELTIDSDLPDDEYIISIAVLDPAGMLPSLRFAIQNYFTGGRHPMGRVGFNTAITDFEIKPEEFKAMKDDHTLKYTLP